MDYNARFYSSSLGRFISADTIVPGTEDPMAFDRYHYGSNNPLKYIDPSGHYGICIVGGPNSIQQLAPGEDNVETENSSMNQLCGKLDGSGLLGSGYETISNDTDSLEEALLFILENFVDDNGNLTEEIQILGYSAGGEAALKLTEMLNDNGIIPDTLITIDAVLLEHEAESSVVNFLSSPSVFQPKLVLDEPEAHNHVNIFSTIPGGLSGRNPLNLKAEQEFVNALNVGVSENHSTIMTSKETRSWIKLFLQSNESPYSPTIAYR